MQGMLTRHITKELLYALDNNPAVVILGARQIGKTTLAKSIMAKYEGSIYLDLESPEDLLKLSDPLSFLEQNRQKLVILDEIQRTPEIFMILRGLIDKNRQSGKKSSQYLLLGSASMELMRQSESLAGRVHYINMSGINLLESKPGTTADLWYRGGFPESYLAASELLSMDWLEMLIRTYIERDIPRFGLNISGARLRRLWTMLAHLQGEIINYSNLASNLEVDSKTVTYYLDILQDLLLVHRLNPWYSNLGKRLVKSPRYYVRDSGILHRLLAINSYDALLSNPILGKSWEGFVIENILSIIPLRVSAYYYRTAAGREIDLVLQIASDEIWAIEIKYGKAPKINAPNLAESATDIKANKIFIIYGGDDEFPINNNVTMISLHRFMEKLLLATTTIKS